MLARPDRTVVRRNHTPRLQQRHIKINNLCRFIDINTQNVEAGTGEREYGCTVTHREAAANMAAVRSLTAAGVAPMIRVQPHHQRVALHPLPVPSSGKAIYTPKMPVPLFMHVIRNRMLRAAPCSQIVNVSGRWLQGPVQLEDQPGIVHRSLRRQPATSRRPNNQHACLIFDICCSNSYLGGRGSVVAIEPRHDQHALMWPELGLYDLLVELFYLHRLGLPPWNSGFGIGGRGYGGPQNDRGSG